ncbi:MerR family transcriptional regulator [Nonomuraea sp. NPDC050394]|uniref:MerR family transcriptional regulator n=1 Tax=Nonomuraea sp. NPDC050394 TaxID=3364363 RepID=UPI0037BBE2E4
MDGYTIGDLARRTGLTVKTVRFYSDKGIVPPSGRSHAGYRLYDLDALARLDLVRTLRELGLDLATIRKVVDRELSLPEVAAAHAEALEVQMRALRLRRAVLRAVARRGSTPEETDIMHKLARLSADERRRLIDDFLDATLTGVHAGVRRSLTPELPDDPEVEQVEAWVELAELTRDAGFRAAVRLLAEHHEAGASVPRPDPVAIIRSQVRQAMAAGVDPASPEAKALAETGNPLMEAAGDPRWIRYLHLLAIVNGWPPPEDPAPLHEWYSKASGKGS